jgi:hypothetical protein
MKVIKKLELSHCYKGSVHTHRFVIQRMFQCRSDTHQVPLKMMMNRVGLFTDITATSDLVLDTALLPSKQCGTHIKRGLQKKGQLHSA